MRGGEGGGRGSEEEAGEQEGLSAGRESPSAKHLQASAVTFIFFFRFLIAFHFFSYWNEPSKWIEMGESTLPSHSSPSPQALGF